MEQVDGIWDMNRTYNEIGPSHLLTLALKRPSLPLKNSCFYFEKILIHLLKVNTGNRHPVVLTGKNCCEASSSHQPCPPVWWMREFPSQARMKQSYEIKAVTFNWCISIYAKISCSLLMKKYNGQLVLCIAPCTLTILPPCIYLSKLRFSKGNDINTHGVRWTY